MTRTKVPKEQKDAAYKRLRDIDSLVRRLPSNKGKKIIDIEVSCDDPRLGIKSPTDLRVVLEEIADESSNKIMKPQPSPSGPRVFSVRVMPGAFHRRFKKPLPEKHGTEWRIIIGRKKYLTGGRIGSLSGELFAVMVDHWGKVRRLDTILDEIRSSVTDERWSKEWPPSLKQVKEALRQMKGNLRESLELLGDAERSVEQFGDIDSRDEVGLRWQNFLWNIRVRKIGGAPHVGIISPKIPTRSSEKGRKQGTK